MRLRRVDLKGVDGRCRVAGRRGSATPGGTAAVGPLALARCRRDTASSPASSAAIGQSTAAVMPWPRVRSVWPMFTPSSARTVAVTHRLGEMADSRTGQTTKYSFELSQVRHGQQWPVMKITCDEVGKEQAFAYTWADPTDLRIGANLRRDPSGASPQGIGQGAGRKTIRAGHDRPGPPQEWGKGRP